MTHASTPTGPEVLRAAAARPGGSPVERPAPLRQAVFDALVEMIITYELQPGEHLIEKDLAAALGVSRQPVREALQRMHTEGWVDLRPALGAFVHIPAESEADQLRRAQPSRGGVRQAGRRAGDARADRAPLGAPTHR